MGKSQGGCGVFKTCSFSSENTENITSAAKTTNFVIEILNISLS